MLSLRTVPPLWRGGSGGGGGGTRGGPLQDLAADADGGPGWPHLQIIWAQIVYLAFFKCYQCFLCAFVSPLKEGKKKKKREKIHPLHPLTPTQNCTSLWAIRVFALTTNKRGAKLTQRTPSTLTPSLLRLSISRKATGTKERFKRAPREETQSRYLSASLPVSPRLFWCLLLPAEKEEAAVH